MINKMQIAIIKKDIRGITANKRMLAVLLVVPLVMTVVLPSSFILPVLLTPIDSPDFAQLTKIPGFAFSGGGPDDIRRSVVLVIINSIMPVFFLFIPIMASSVMAASAFVGEKEKKTLETLLYCPLPLKDIFGAKVLASFTISMAVSFLSFAVMLLVVETELAIVTRNLTMPGINWPVMLLLVMPAVSLLAVNLIVRGSAKAQSVEESQQRSVFLILPLILFSAGQFTGIMMLSPWLLVVAGVVLAAAAVFMLKGSFGKFQYETLLR